MDQKADKISLNETLLTEMEAAAILGVTARTLQKWRRRDYGPVYFLITAKTIRYRRSDLFNWLNFKSSVGAEVSL